MRTGIVVPLNQEGAEAIIRPYPEIREIAMAADQHGLDSAWIFDHLLFRHEDQDQFGIWEAWTVWTALAEATERIDLGSLVLCTAFRNPAVLAKMAGTLDHVSNGRIILGIGAGWHEPEFDAFGLDFSHKVDQFEEAVNIIAPLLRENKADFQGKYHSANNCGLIPPPERKIPILIAGKRPRMMGLVARHADAYNTCWHGDVASIEENHQNLQLACKNEGRDFEDIDFTVGIRVHFPQLGGEAPDNSDDPAEWISGSVEDVAAGLAKYQEKGVSDVIAILSPLKLEAVELLAKSRSILEGHP